MMTPNFSKELLEFHMKHDPLFAELCAQTEKEKNDAEFAVGLALISLALEGKVRIMKDNFGQLLFEKSDPN